MKTTLFAPTTQRQHLCPASGQDHLMLDIMIHRYPDLVSHEQGSYVIAIPDSVEVLMKFPMLKLLSKSLRKELIRYVLQGEPTLRAVPLESLYKDNAQ